MAYDVRPLINAFIAGELSSSLDGRTDYGKYNYGCRRLENFIVRPHGSVFRRPGSRFIHQAKDPHKQFRLIPFDFNSTATQSYILEVGDGFVRFYKDGGIIVDSSGSIYEIASPWTQEQLFQIQYVQSCDTLYLVHPQVRPQRLTRLDHAHWDLQAISFDAPGCDWNIISTSLSIPPDGRHGQTVLLPAGEIFESGVVLRGQKPDGTPAWFRYRGEGFHDSLEGTQTLTFYNTPGQNNATIESIHIAGKLTNHWQSLTTGSTMPSDWKEGNWPSCIGFYEDRLVLAATPEKPLSLWLSRSGQYEDFRMNTAAAVSGAPGEPFDDDAIAITLSGSRVNPVRWVLDQEQLMVGTNASEIKVWSGMEGQGMTPSRLQRKRQSAYGSGTFQAQLVSNTLLYVSRSGRKIREMNFNYSSYTYESPELTLLADHITGEGIIEMDYAREPEGILWAVRKDGLLIGCTYLREENIIAWHRHPLGGNAVCESVACIPGPQGDEVWLAVRRVINGSVVRFIERLDPAFAPGDHRTPAHRHIDAGKAFYLDSGLSSTGTPVTHMTHTSPACITCPGHDLVQGDKVALEGLVFHRHQVHPPEQETGSATEQEQSIPEEKFYTVSHISQADADTLVLAELDGTRCDISPGNCLVYRVRSEVSGLGHLEGEKVSIMGDGALQVSRTVRNGRVRLSRPAARIHVGLPYSSVLQPMRLNITTASGTAQTRPKRIMSVATRFADTIGGRICAGDDRQGQYEAVLPHDHKSISGRPLRLFTGDREIKLAHGFDRDGLFTVRQDDPLPMSIICCVPHVQGAS